MNRFLDIAVLLVVLCTISLSAQERAQTDLHTLDAASHVAKASTTVAEAKPLDLDGKARYFGARLVSPWNLVTPALGAGIEMARSDQKLPREWRQGAGGFGRLYGAGISSLGSFEAARFLSGVALHEDPRYFRAGSISGGARLKHALMFTLMDRSDSGGKIPAVSTFIGAAAGGTVGNLYLPPPYNQKRYALSRSAVVLAYYAGSNIRREFTPELNRLLRKLRLPASHE